MVHAADSTPPVPRNGNGNKKLAIWIPVGLALVSALAAGLVKLTGLAFATGATTTNYVTRAEIDKAKADAKQEHEHMSAETGVLAADLSSTRMQVAVNRAELEAAKEQVVALREAIKDFNTKLDHVDQKVDQILLRGRDR